MNNLKFYLILCFLFLLKGSVYAQDVWVNEYYTPFDSASYMSTPPGSPRLYSYDGQDACIYQTSDQGFLVGQELGSRNTVLMRNSGHARYHKFDQFGNELWTKDINPESSNMTYNHFFNLESRFPGIFLQPDIGGGFFGISDLQVAATSSEDSFFLKKYDDQLNEVWSKQLDFGDEIYGVGSITNAIQTSNGEYLVVGSIMAYIGSDTTINIGTSQTIPLSNCRENYIGTGLMKFDNNGDLISWNIYNSTINTVGKRYFKHLPTGDQYEETVVGSNLYFAHSGFALGVLWITSTDIVEHSDHTYTISLSDRNYGNGTKFKAIHVDTLGNILWESASFYSTGTGQYSGQIKLLSNGDIILFLDGTIARLNHTDGTTIWQRNDVFPATTLDAVGDIHITSNDEIICVGATGLAKLDEFGNTIFEKHYSTPHPNYSATIGGWSYIARGPKDLLAITPTNDNHFVLIGLSYANNYSPYHNPPLLPPSGYWNGVSIYSTGHIIKLDSTLSLWSNTIQGTVFRDSISDCVQQAQEIPFSRIGVIATQQNTGAVFYAMTDSNGNYYMEVDTGYYDIETFHNYLFFDENASCSFGAIGDTLSGIIDTVNIPMEAAFDCPLMVVDIGTPILRPCQPSKYTVSYHNYGTVDADDVEVWVNIDPYLTIDSTSLPIVGQQGDSVLFDVGHVNWMNGGSFDIWVTTSCSATIGQTHCVSASITPDTVCQPTPGWDGADIRVNGWCDGDTARFEIENVGQNMNSSRGYLVIEENIINVTNNYQLAGGDQLNLNYNTNGLTYRVEAEQTTGHPWALKSSATVYGCGTNPVFSFTPSIYFDNDASPFYSLSCQQNSYYNFLNKANTNQVANDKQGYPLGYGAHNAIDPGQVLEYKIRFQNTGTDSVSRVQILDTLASELDLTTILMGASSHPYTWTIHAGGILEIEFDPIALPDSTTNEVGSHGFIKFKIGQNPTNPIGTVIENNAAIYLDYAAPIMTNTTFHTVDTGYIQVDLIPNNGGDPNSVNEVDSEISYQVIPNPFQTSAMIQVQGIATQDMYIEVYNALGQQLLRLEDQDGSGQFPLHKADLSSGVHFFSLKRNGELIQSGRFIVQ